MENANRMGNKWDAYSVDLNTIVRGIIAAVVISVSYILTRNGAEISKEWEAILLVVVGYYFKDRPVEESEAYSRRGLQIEIIMQFLLGVTLICATAAVFLRTGSTEISGAWIAAVILAVGFYFKVSRSEIQGTHSLCQTLVAALVASLTVTFVTSLYEHHPQVPKQWVAIVVIVVGFYFKQQVMNWRNKR